MLGPALTAGLQHVLVDPTDVREHGVPEHLDHDHQRHNCRNLPAPVRGNECPRKREGGQCCVGHNFTRVVRVKDVAPQAARDQWVFLTVRARDCNLIRLVTIGDVRDRAACYGHAAAQRRPPKRNLDVPCHEQRRADPEGAQDAEPQAGKALPVQHQAAEAGVRPFVVLYEPHQAVRAMGREVNPCRRAPGLEVGHQVQDDERSHHLVVVNEPAHAGPAFDAADRVAEVGPGDCPGNQGAPQHARGGDDQKTEGKNDVDHEVSTLRL